VLKVNPDISKNKGTSLWNFVPNSGLNIRFGISIVETYYQLSSRNVDAQSVINLTVVGHLVDSTSELRRSTAVVYRSNHQALSAARTSDAVKRRQSSLFRYARDYLSDAEFTKITPSYLAVSSRLPACFSVRYYGNHRRHVTRNWKSSSAALSRPISALN